MSIFLKRIVENERLRLRKKEKPTQHIVSTDVVDDIWARVFVTGSYAKVMIPKAIIPPQIGLSSGKRKNSRLPVITNFIAMQRWSTVWSVNNYPGQEAFRRPTLGNGAGRIQNIQGRMLITADIAKRDTADVPP